MKHVGSLITLLISTYIIAFQVAKEMNNLLQDRMAKKVQYLSNEVRKLGVVRPCEEPALRVLERYWKMSCSLESFSC